MFARHAPHHHHRTTTQNLPCVDDDDVTQRSVKNLSFIFIDTTCKLGDKMKLLWDAKLKTWPPHSRRKVHVSFGAISKMITARAAEWRGCIFFLQKWVVAYYKKKNKYLQFHGQWCVKVSDEHKKCLFRLMRIFRVAATRQARGGRKLCRRRRAVLKQQIWK